ncbi:TlpA disulfide reductase family protein [Jatrophihabitans sp.]|uniref:TlpA disulfide reductase family protein n=1 Tax=Jatrophihabitans sp. TaxID=1932789 RepID=UPI0030C714D7|nr:Alkyl hydroperoxide reductase/Thiol specific antioxidant [Jatrophihabitans sp.]
MNKRIPSVAAARVAVAGVLVTAALVVSGCTGSDAVSQSGGTYRFVSLNKIGTLLPAAKRQKIGTVTTSLLDGGTYSLASDLGKVVVVNFWATWCGPCTTETPQFDSVYREYKGKGVTFLGIDTKESNRSAPRAFVKDNHISYPIAFDEQGETSVKLGKIPAISLPYTVILDKEQRVAAVYDGTVLPKDLTPVLDKLVAET